MSPTDQRMAALATANRIRTDRRVLKERVRSGELSLPRVLASVPPYAETMRIYDLVRATPAVGDVKTERILRSLQIPPDRQLQELTAHERMRIVMAARDRYPATWRRWQTEAAA